MEINVVKTMHIKNIQTSLASHNELSRIFNELNGYHGNVLVLDFKDASFISANQYAVLGCILDDFYKRNPNTLIEMKNASDKLLSVMQVNGFGRHFSLPAKPDIHHTAIPYRMFSVREIGEFEKYIVLNIFSRSDLPNMSEGVKGRIIDSILEIFNNVKEHTHCKNLFTCGQYFPSKSLLYFTIADAGETIQQNVFSFLKENKINPPSNALEWAMQSGNSTRRVNSPGGLGLYLLSDFITRSHGELYMISGNEVFEQNSKGQRCTNLNYEFGGTIVTMAFNLSDEYNDCMSSEEVDFIF